MTIFEILNEIEYYESRSMYKLADTLLDKVVKVSAQANQFGDYNQILAPVDFQAQIQFIRTACPEVMNGPSAGLQQFESYKVYMLENMKKGLKPKEIAENYFKQNNMKITGNFRGCFERMYKQLVGQNLPKDGLADSTQLTTGANPLGAQTALNQDNRESVPM